MYTQETVGGRVLIMTCTGGYVQALDTGHFCVGEPREEGGAGIPGITGSVKGCGCIYIGEGPQAGEVFSIVRIGEAKLAMKSAYGRFVSVSVSGELAGRMEAVGPREQWEFVFEEVRNNNM